MTILRGEVWETNFDPTVGTEISKIRPAVIVNNDDIGVLPQKIIVPITTWNPRFEGKPWHVHLFPNGGKNGLQNESSADTFQVKNVDQQRLLRKIGELSDSELTLICEGLKICMDLDY